jgi:CHASE1-domain containing sensor protein/tRNA A-37 threonylcarbamoyl transferase component Bud32
MAKPVEHRTKVPKEKASTYLTRRFAIAIVLGSALSFALALAVFQRAQATEQAAFEKQAASVAAELESSFLSPLPALVALDAFTRSNPLHTPEQFRIFSGSLHARYPKVASLVWDAVVSSSERATFEQRESTLRGRPFAIQEPTQGGTLVPALARDQYIVIARQEPYVRFADGLIQDSDSLRKKFLRDVVERRTTTVTPKFRLLGDPPDVFSVVVSEPQFASDGAFTGLALLVYRIHPLVDPVANSHGAEGLNLTLRDMDTSLTVDEQLIFSKGVLAGADAYSFQRAFSFGGRTWRMDVEKAKAPHYGTAIAAAAAGILLTLALAMAVAGRRVTSELRSRNRELTSLRTYTIVRPLGRGGMGEVFEATHRLLRRRVAIKIIRAGVLTKELSARFAREATLMSRLTHPNTVTLFDYGQTTEGEFYYVMEYLVGLTLEALVLADGPLPPARARHLLTQICEAIAEAQDLGLVHRDIKPSNIMACKRAGACDFIKVLDFGLARRIAHSPSELSAKGAAIGTPHTMAPEAFVEPSAVGTAADIYSIGCIAFLLLSGKHVFEGFSGTRLVQAHVTAPPPYAPRFGT